MVIALDEALALAARAREAAQREGMQIAVAITDPSGLLVAVMRMDGAFPAAVDAAIAKARCAALYRRPTSRFAESQRAGKPVAYLPHVVPLGGGLPLVCGGDTIGALGLSGAVEATETELAERIVAAFEGQAE